MDIQTQGVVLSYEDYKEVDRIITVYTRDLGTLRVIARGVRKIQAKLAGHLELFNFTELQLVYKKNFLVISAININNFQAIKEDARKVMVAFAISELTKKATQEQHKDERILALFINILRLLEQSKKDVAIFYYFFAFHFAAYLGYKPELNVCIECQKKLTPHGIFFSVSQGGTMCEACYNTSLLNDHGRVRKITPNTLKVIRLFFEDTEMIERLRIDKKTLEELKIITDRYIRFNLGVEIKTNI